MHVQDRVGR